MNYQPDINAAIIALQEFASVHGIGNDALCSLKLDIDVRPERDYDDPKLTVLQRTKTEWSAYSQFYGWGKAAETYHEALKNLESLAVPKMREQLKAKLAEVEALEKRIDALNLKAIDEKCSVITAADPAEA